VNDETAPTLKMRVAFPDVLLGADCRTAAQEVISPNSMRLLDAKWGRPEPEWIRTGRGWGRSRLSEWQRGYIDACQRHDPTEVEQTLLDIISQLTQYQQKEATS
jgi:hypothetical protein